MSNLARVGKFTGKTALITGASSGIGRELALQLAREGAALALLARRADRLERLVSEIRTNGGRAVAISGDVTSESDLRSAADRARREFGSIDIVVANAGFGVAGEFQRLTVEDYRRQFETNVFGVLNTIYATLDDLKKSRGVLALLGSVSGYVSLPGSSPYGMSKFAVHALASSLHAELADFGVNVLLVAPGFVESEIRMVDNQGVLRTENDDPISPKLRVPTDRAVREIVQAIAARNREVIVTGHGKVIVFVQRHFPWVLRALVKFGLRGRKEPN